MTNQTRRQFLKNSALGAAAIEGGTWSVAGRARAASQQKRPTTIAPDLVLLNGRIYTVDDRRPKAEAFAVKQGRFVAVGTTDQIRPLVAPGTQVIDAGGMTVTPGFIDAHTHPASAGVSELLKVNCDLRTIAEIKDAMRQRAKRTPPGRWVMGFKYDDTKLRDGRRLARADLDQAVADHPAQVLHRGGHTAVYNSVAFKLAGVDKTTPDPPGGKFGRDAGGELTGFVAEKAKSAFNQVAPQPPVPIVKPA